MLARYLTGEGTQFILNESVKVPFLYPIKHNEWKSQAIILDQIIKISENNSILNMQAAVVNVVVSYQRS